MARLTVKDTIEKLAALSFPGVKTVRSFPPASVSTAQLPYMFFRNTIFKCSEFPMAGTGGYRTLLIEALILIDASRQGTQAELYVKTREILDSIALVLEENAPDLRLDDYTIRETDIPIQDTSYFAVIVEMNFS